MGTFECEDPVDTSNFVRFVIFCSDDKNGRFEDVDNFVVNAVFDCNDVACVGRAFLLRRVFVEARVLHLVKSLFY